MSPPKRRKASEEKVNAIVKEILDESSQKNLPPESSNRCPENCMEIEQVEEQKEEVEESPAEACECSRLAENSSRFSLRVMEAMRSLQRADEALLPTSTAEKIVGYIESNYRDVGDLYAQVRTALKQVCSQGFAVELLENEYLLIGPAALSMNRITSSTESDPSLVSSSSKTDTKNRGNSKTEPRSKPKTKRSTKLSHDNPCDCNDENSPKKIAASPHDFSRRSARIAGGKLRRNSSRNAIHDANNEESLPSEESSECSTCNFAPSEESLDRCACNSRPDGSNADLSRRNQMALRKAPDNSGKRNLWTSLPEGRKELPQNRGENPSRSLMLQTSAPKGEKTSRVSNGERLAGAKHTAKRTGFDTEGGTTKATEHKRGSDAVDSDTDETTSKSVEDLYLDLKRRDSSTRSKSREKELRRWIKRCREECEKRRTR